jgi:hypothetical protein
LNAYSLFPLKCIRKIICLRAWLLHRQMHSTWWVLQEVRSKAKGNLFPIFIGWGVLGLRQSVDWGGGLRLRKAILSEYPTWTEWYFLKWGRQVGKGLDEYGVDYGDGVEVEEVIISNFLLPAR